jgi:hypothetical protein
MRRRRARGGARPGRGAHRGDRARRRGRDPGVHRRDRDEQRYEVAVDPGRDYGFDLEHLEVHREQALPVLVRLEERGDVLLAVEIFDA